MEGVNVKHRIAPELSAQGIRKNQNPMLPTVLAALAARYALNGAPRQLRVVDQGCGQLRNVAALRKIASRLILVDTEEQLLKCHNFFGTRLTVGEFAKRQWPRDDIRILSTSEFDASEANADIVFSICVLDAVPPKTRTQILRAARKNLARDGLLVIIVPRNDSWTMNRCAEENTYADGHLLAHPNGYTFYRNWDTKALSRLVRRSGFTVEQDLSVYRHGCLLCTVSQGN